MCNDTGKSQKWLKIVVFQGRFVAPKLPDLIADRIVIPLEEFLADLLPKERFRHLLQQFPLHELFTVRIPAPPRKAKGFHKTHSRRSRGSDPGRRVQALAPSGSRYAADAGSPPHRCRDRPPS